MVTDPISVNRSCQQTVYDWVEPVTKRPPLQTIPNMWDQAKQQCIDYVLSGRVQQLWQEIVMIAGVAIAVSGFVLTLFSSSVLISGAFFALTLTSSAGLYFFGQFASLEELQQTVADLQMTQARYKRLADHFERENNRLSGTNRALSQNNARLTHQTVQLSLQVAQLQESAERIKTEVVHFQEQNAHLHQHAHGFQNSLQVLDNEINSSKELCNQISCHLSTQQQGLGEQLDELRKFLAELRGFDGVQRIRQVLLLNDQLQSTGQKLARVEGEYAAGLARLEEIGNTFALLREGYSQDFKDNIQAMQQQAARMRQLVAAAWALHIPLQQTSARPIVASL